MFKVKKNGSKTLKLIDYGLCADYLDHSWNSLLKDKSGTACYIAPEIIGFDIYEKFYDQRADVFSVGIILYEMI